MPVVSVVIPCFNQGSFLDESIGSVLAQTFEDFEIIVVDDGSTDAVSMQAFESFHYPKARLIRSKNQGLPAARNLAISHATGRYILPLDCDDKIAPSYLAKAVALPASDDPAVVEKRSYYLGSYIAGRTLRLVYEPQI